MTSNLVIQGQGLGCIAIMLFVWFFLIFNKPFKKARILGIGKKLLCVHIELFCTSCQFKRTLFLESKNTSRNDNVMQS